MPTGVANKGQQPVELKPVPEGVILPGFNASSMQFICSYHSGNDGRERRLAKWFTGRSIGLYRLFYCDDCREKVLAGENPWVQQ